MIVSTDKARRHTHSKPCKHNVNRISISTNPLFNHVYSARVPSNDTENTIMSLYTLLMWCIILYRLPICSAAAAARVKQTGRINYIYTGGNDGIPRETEHCVT